MLLLQPIGTGNHKVETTTCNVDFDPQVYTVLQL